MIQMVTLLVAWLASRLLESEVCNLNGRKVRETYEIELNANHDDDIATKQPLAAVTAGWLARYNIVTKCKQKLKLRVGGTITHSHFISIFIVL